MMQTALFDGDTADKIHEIFIQDLKRGSGFIDGKKRIVEFFKRNLSKAETIKLLKDEYGNGGRSTIASGGYRQSHDASGVEIMLVTREKKKYTWSQVYDALFNLIESKEYWEESK